MSEIPASVGAITLFVEDPKRSKAFYERVFGLGTIFEDDASAAFKFESTIVNLLALPAASDLIAPGTVAVVKLVRFQLTIWVDDTDAVSAELAGRGVTLLNGRGPGVGGAYGELHRSRRPHLGGGVRQTEKLADLYGWQEPLQTTRLRNRRVPPCMKPIALAFSVLALAAAGASAADAGPGARLALDQDLRRGR